jgi:hypothetical protein
MSSTAESRPPNQSRCPICGKPAAQSVRPFCSRRCADVDLHRWLSGVYAAPAVEAEEDDDSQGDGDASARGR